MHETTSTVLKCQRLKAETKRKKLWYYDVVLDHIIGRDSPFIHGVADGVRAGSFGLFGSEEPKRKNETSGDCIDTLNEKCKRQKSEENHSQVNFVHQSQVLHDVDAENGQPAQLQKTDVCMTVYVYAASRGGTGSICTLRSSCTNTADSPLKSTRISTEQGASECQKPVSTSKPIKISCASQGTTRVQKKASASSTQRDDSYETLQAANEYSPESTSPSSGANLPKKKKENYDRLVVLEIQKAKAEIDILKTKKEAQGQKERVQAMRDQVALQREHLALKKERALINLQIEREKAFNQTYIEKEVTELNLLKEKLKIEKCNARKIQLEVQMLEEKCTQLVVMTIDDYNNNVTNQ